MCSLQTGLWALIVFTVLVRGLDVSPGVGFWVHDKPRNFGELQLALPLIIFPCFFMFFRLWQDHCNQCTEESYKGAPLFFRHSFISFGHGSLLHILKWPACSWVLELLCCRARYCSPFTDVIWRFYPEIWLIGSTCWLNWIATIVGQCPHSSRSKINWPPISACSVVHFPNFFVGSYLIIPTYLLTQSIYRIGCWFYIHPNYLVLGSYVYQFSLNGEPVAATNWVSQPHNSYRW